MSTTINHGQIAKVEENGDIDVFYPKTFSQDVYVDQSKKSLETFLGTASISTIGDGTISGAISSVNTAVTSVDIGYTISTATDFNTLTEHGRYTIVVGDCPNSPTPATGGMLFVGVAPNGSCKQVYINDAANLYERYYQGGWSAWKCKDLDLTSDIILNDGGNDTPGVMFITKDYGTWMIDVWYNVGRFLGPNVNLELRDGSISYAGVNLLYFNALLSSYDWRTPTNWTTGTYYYEGNGSNYGAPCPHCTVQTNFIGNRGTAIAVNWDGRDPHMWICANHDGWGGWAQMARIADVDTRLNNYLPLSGGTLSGGLTTNGGLTVNGGVCNINTAGTWGGTLYINDLRLNNASLHSNVASQHISAMCSGGFHVRTSDDAAPCVCHASSFNTDSSRRIKENIQDISEEDAKKLLDVDVVKFDYIEEVGGIKNQYGVIAEDVAEIYPSTVNIPEGYDPDAELDTMFLPSVDYSKFVPFLIKMVQMQQKEIDELKKKLGMIA